MNGLYSLEQAITSVDRRQIRPIKRTVSLLLRAETNMARISSRVDEANKFLENGHKFMKTSLLKWSPDYDNAANQYNQAAMAFKGAGLHQKAIEANELAIKCYLATPSSAFQAAKCMEQAALSSKELGDYQAVSKYYTRAINIYKTIGQLDTAMAVMDRAAKALASQMPTMAADLYIQASEAAVIEDRYRQAAEYCNKAAVLYLKAKEYKRAANIAIEEINCYAQANDTRTCNKTAIGVILIHLADNNIVGAMDALKRCNMDDDVYHLANDLVTGFDKKDARLLNSTLNNSFFRNLDTEFAKLARDILSEHGKIVETSNDPDPNNKNEDVIPDEASLL
jgi:tetratricopeptide (TPR) repeat protein